MHVLYPKHTVDGYQHLVLPLDSVHWQLDEAAVLDPKFRVSLNTSLDIEGMLWPPIVTTTADIPSDTVIDKPYYVTIGNNRLQYAADKGYSHIQCVYVDSWEDRQTVHAATLMEYCVDY
jgi:hypothetical protein